MSELYESWEICCLGERLSACQEGLWYTELAAIQWTTCHKKLPHACVLLLRVIFILSRLAFCSFTST